MPEQQKINPSIQVEQAKKFLFTFYKKPIAQISTELFFTIAATIFFAIFAIKPTILTMTELIKEIEDKKKTVELLKRKAAALSTVQTTYFSLQDRFYLFDETIPENISFEQSLKILEKVASDLQMSISTLQVQELPVHDLKETPFAQKKAQLVNLTIGVTGSYAQIRDFTQHIRTLRPLLSIDSLSITSSQSDEELDFLTATITIQGHYYAKPTTKATTTTNTEKKDEPNL